MEVALAEEFDVVNHVVAKVVEAEFVVCTVGDVGGVSFFTGAGAKVTETFVVVFFVVVVAVVDEGGFADDDACCHTEEIVDGAVPASVALCEVIVYGDEVGAFTFEGVEV